MIQPAVKLRTLAVCAAMIFFSTGALAGKTDLSAARMPPDLMYHGKPMEPYCFSDIDDQQPTTLELTDCGPENVIHAMLRAGKEHVVCYKSRPDNDDGMSFFSYCYVGRYHGSVVLLTEDGGRNGWSAVSLIEVNRVNKEKAVASYIAKGGDGYGGVTDATIENGHLYYGKYIQAYDFLTLAGDNPHKLTNMKDIGANDTRIVDFGLAHYEDNALISVDLQTGGVGDDNGDLTTRFPLQSCFNKIFNEYIKSGKTTLTPNELKEFTRRFNTLCIEQPKQ